MKIFSYFREYKEALRQQRSQDVPVYRTRDHGSASSIPDTKTEPNTPTHQIHTGLATSKSDPTPLHSVLSSHPKQIFDDTNNSPKRPVQKVPPVRINPQINGDTHHNGSLSPQKFIKPTSPIKNSSGILSHDHVPSPGKIKCLNTTTSPKLVTTTVGYVTGPPNGTCKSPNKGGGGTRTISWNRDIPPEKLSFTMRREFDKAREESDLIEQLRTVS